jgi:PAS domain S-box-containing protein
MEMGKPLRVLMVEDSEDDVLLMVRALKQGGYDPVYEQVEDALSMRKALEKGSWDVILCDYQMPQFDGLAAIALLKETGIDIPLIIVSGVIGEEMAVACMRQGAQDYVMKGNLPRLVPAIERELKEAESRSQRKQVEQKLLEEKTYVNSIVQTAQTIVLVLDTTGHIVSFNPYMENISGYTLEEVQGKDWFSTFLPEYEQNKTREVFLRAVNDVQTRGNVNPIVTKDGRERIIEWYDKTLKDEKGNTVGLLSTGQDITERRRVEDEIRRAEENFRKSLYDSPLGMRIVTIEGETIYANRAILDIHGYNNVDELRETTAKKRYAAESYAEHQIRKEKRKRGDYVPSEYTISIVRKDRKIRHLQVFRKEVLWNGERQFQVIYQDITDRKQAEEALRKSQERLREAHRLAYIGVWNWVADTDTVTWSEELYRIAGLDPMLPAPTYAEHPNIYAPESWELLKEAVERAIRTGEPYQLELKLIRPDSTTRWVIAFGGATYDNHGRMEGLYGTVQDITDRKQVEEELKTSRLQLRALAGRLQQIREEEKIMISREIHDEMGGGLTGLKMDLSWLSQQLDKTAASKERIALMNRIHESKKLIDQMINIARRIALDLRPSVLDDLGLVAALEWQLSEFTRRTKIQHELATTVEYVNMEETTAVAVFRIFQEALTNVALHSEATKVAVAFKEGERSLFGDENLILEIRDNGRGITDEEILNPGSLGLLGMKERVLAFGGELSIRGEPGGGTTLILKMPRIKGEPQ